MNHREPPHLPAGVRRVLRCFSLLLLPLLAPEAAPAFPRPRNSFGSGADRPESEALPYLSFVGAPPLRIQRATPPPDLVARPASAAPPVPPLTPTESAVALANAAAARSTAASTRANDEGPVTDLKPEVAPPPAPAKPAPPSILPDDTRPQVRPEDFLPYFQIPGSAKSSGEVNVIMPASTFTAPSSAPLPPSSATYTQSPK
jgi:hypothetical protein